MRRTVSDAKYMLDSMCLRWSKKSTPGKRLTGVMSNLLITKMFWISLKRYLVAQTNSN